MPRRIRDRLFGHGAWLVYVPAARSPHKPGGPVAPDRDRVRMLRLATARVPRCAIWMDEIDRAGAGPSYWIETLRRAVRAAPPGTHIRFLIGSDQAVAFHRWREFREILNLAEPAVMLRPPHKDAGSVLRAMQETGAWTGAELEHWAAWIDDARVMKESSTAARAAIARGRTAGGVPGVVRAYIKRRGLYTERERSPRAARRSRSALVRPSRSAT